jgi:hypothetical protein
VNSDFFFSAEFIGNFAPTAAEVKDLISGNIPFKWQYGSQTESSNSLTQIGAVALYDQTSITANNWFDLANGNTGAVTGASVLNPKGIAVDEDNIPVLGDFWNHSRHR